MNRDWILTGATKGGFDWHGSAAPTTRKALVDANHNLKRIWYLERAVEMSRAVARVAFPDEIYVATCFLVAPNLILTNHHVFEDPADTTGVRIQFDYRERFDGTDEVTEEHICDPGTFVTDEHLDFSLVGLKESPKRAYLNLRHNELPQTAGHVAILQHPQGEALQAALRDNSLVYHDDIIVEYLTNTDYGSSGAPVFNDNWNVIALHSQRVKDPSVTDQTVWYRNRGIAIREILADPEVDRLIPSA